MEKKKNQIGNWKLVISVISFVQLCGCNTAIEQKSETIKNDGINSSIYPPIENITIANQVYKVNVENDTILTYRTGSKIYIPEDAFIDENGNIIKGAVDLKYREFHDPLDFFIAGVPMTIDSSGVEKVFESAGMCEISAFKDGKTVYPNPQRKIKLEMTSFFLFHSITF